MCDNRFAGMGLHARARNSTVNDNLLRFSRFPSNSTQNKKSDRVVCRNVYNFTMSNMGEEWYICVSSAVVPPFDFLSLFVHDVFS